MNGSHEAEEPHPAQDLVERLALERLDRFAAEGEPALDDVRQSHPEHVEAVRALLESLSRFGLIEEPAAAPAENQERIGDYRLLERIGGGGMGVVWLAEQMNLGRRVALKLLRPGLLAFPRSRERFRREVEAAGRLDHPGICTVYDAGEAAGTPYLAMRYLDGETLARRIERARADVPEGGALPSRDGVLAMAALVESVARAAHHAHEQGLVHRDIKPSNIMVGSDGTPVLLDFGLARLDEPGEGGLTLSGDLLGTPAYMAPEQISGRRPVDRRSDVYALGATLYEAVTLRPPFTAPTRESLLREIAETEPTAASRRARCAPRDLDVVLATALDKDPDRRYRTALDFAEDLRRVRLREPIRARPLPLALRARRWTQRNPALAVLVVTLALGLAVSLGLVGWVSNSLTHVRALALASASAEVLPTSPRLAMLLARAGVAECEMPETVSSLQAALAELHERASWPAHALTKAGTDFPPMGPVQFAPSGDRIWSFASDGTAKVWTTSGEPVATFSEPGAIWGGLAPDGRRFVLMLENGGVLVYDSQGQRLRLVDRHRIGPTRVVWAKDGSRFLTCSDDRTAVLWDRDGNELVALPQHEGRVLVGAISRDCQSVLTAVAADDKSKANAPTQICIWSLAGGKAHLQARAPGHGALVFHLMFAPDGSSFLSSSLDGTARRWSLDGKELAHFPHRPGQRVCALFSPDGQRVLTFADDLAALWTCDGKEIAPRMQRPGTVVMGSWSPDGRRILTCTSTGEVLIWDAAGEPLATLRGHRHHVANGSFSPDGKSAVTAAWDGEIIVWDVDNPDFPVLRGHRDGVRLATCCSVDGSQVLTVARDGEVRMWVGGELRPLHSLGAACNVAASSPDGGFLLTARKGDCSLWRVGSSGLTEVRSAKRNGLVLGACIGPAARRFAAAYRDGSACVWSAAGGEPIVIEASSVTWARSLAFSPDGKWLAVGYANGKVRLFACAGELLRFEREIPCHEQEIRSIDFSPEGDRLLTASTDATACVWSLSGQRLVELAGHDAAVWSALFSPDGSRIVTQSDQVRVWGAGGKLVMTLRVGSDACSTCFSPDGERILTGSWDGTARLWYARPNALEEVAYRRATLGFTERERKSYAAYLGR